MNEAIFFSCIAISIWPVFVWCLERYCDRSDDPFGILALLTLILCLILRCRGVKALDVDSEGASMPPTARPPGLTLLLVLTAYILLIPFGSKLTQSVVALTVIGLAAGRSQRIGRPLFGDWLLLYLTLPAVASANFYLGYPLRAFITQLAAFTLRFEGFRVSAQGTMLLWNGQFVEVDAPCGGMKMLWLATYMAAGFSSYYQLRPLRVLILLAVAITGALIANLLRVESLFFLENKIVDWGQWHEFLHQGIGVSVFGLLAAMVVFVAHKLSAAPLAVNVESTVQSKNQIRQSPVRSSTAVLIALSLVAAILPLVHPAGGNSAPARAFAGWPTEFEGRPLKPLTENETLQEFSRGFPGKIAIFTDGARMICIRWIAHETRQLHPSADCYRGSGYAITYDPSVNDREGHRWSCITAIRGDKVLHIRERIFDQSGNSWNDVSAWYWSSITQKTRPPWWSISVISH